MFAFVAHNSAIILWIFFGAAHERASLDVLRAASRRLCARDSGNRALGQDVGEIAECILMRMEPRVGGDVDLPFGYVLAVVAAGRQPQTMRGRNQLEAESCNSNHRY